MVGVLKDNSKATQCRTILKVLRERSSSTFDFRQMGIVSPAQRIKELREKGYQIETTRINSIDHTVQPHGGIALYQLISAPD
ncbi:helix-turn-helix domain-containing protein [Histophilus somni]|uniref:helix-turn-helix domain-containing protein n=1 Tax=Histophilus somni TaxID=731 RepID=UPI0011C2425F|nr:helix-turn-helix domain-containing protein [Histophilus somni]QEH09133.1 hypothetical protein FWK43_06345 [Histophilus somni]